MEPGHDKPDAGQRLQEIRGEIDAVDRELLRLLNERASLSREVGRIKATEPGIIFKPMRERDLLDKLAALNPGTLPEEHLRAIWREVLSSSRALQRPQNVAYLGPEGTFSYFAGVEYLGHMASFHPCRDIAGVFEKVCSGDCELGVVPLENTLQGTVGVSLDLFLRHPVFIQAELFSRISHSLMSQEQALADIRAVYSHAQPLAQCGLWLRQHLPNAALVPVESTAAAARRAAAEPGGAAIGHVRLADMTGLNILARGIEDESDNWTRFVIIGPESARMAARAPGHARADKTSILFTLPDRAGTLSAVLTLLAGRGINMRKLESRPMRSHAWRYVFFADVESDMEDSVYADLLEELGQCCTSFRILGRYPAGPQLDRMSLENSAATDKEGL